MSTIIANASVKVDVLNASYEALGRAKLGRALALVIKGDAVIDEADESRTVRSMNGVEYPLPLRIRMLRFIKVPVVHAPEHFSREGVLARDNHTCGYCGKKGSNAEMTHDHIFPKSRGGEDDWMNAVTACMPCNSKKANRTPQEAGMPLLIKPSVPMRFYFTGGKARQKKKKKRKRV